MADLTLEYTNSDGDNINLTPKLSGLDANNNKRYVIDNPSSNINNYTITSTNSLYNNFNSKTIQLNGNNNTIFVKSPDEATKTDGIQLRRFDYIIDTTKQKNETRLYSIFNNNKIPIEEVPIGGGSDISLVSKELHITVEKITTNNKNEFVSMALFINDKFKIWLNQQQMKICIHMIIHLKNLIIKIHIN